MNPLAWVHIAAGGVALLAGATAMAMRKGGHAHVAAGKAFCVAMFALGVTASVLAPFATPAQSPVGGIMVCYFVATAWLAARNRGGRPARIEKIACALVLVLAALMVVGGFAALRGPPGQIPSPLAIFVLAGVCTLAGLGDLRYFKRGTLAPAQRLARHLWRMCFAFFIASGSFFLGQMDVLPASWRVLPVLLVLAFAPIVLMLFWLVRIRLPRRQLLSTTRTAED
jgi:hypothetical protein